MAVASAPKASFELFGFQDGANGFVGYGTEPWLDYLYLLVSGGVGSGKSVGGALRTLLYINSWPGARLALIGPTYDVVRDSSLVALKDVLRTAGLVENTHWEHNKTEKRMSFWNGCQLFLRSDDGDGTASLGLDLAAVWHDEPGRIGYSTFVESQQRLRQQGYPHQMWCSTTPAGKRHWLAKVFAPELAVWEDGEEWVAPELGEYKAYFAPTRDNPHGGAELAASMEARYRRADGSLSQKGREQLEGQFVLTEGLVYPGWDSDKFAVDPKGWPGVPERFVAGIDFGFRNPSAIVVEGLDRAGRRYVVDEFYKAGLSEQQLAAAGTALKQKWGIRHYFADAADPRWIRSLRAAGLPVHNANKKRGNAGDISSGIGLVTYALGHEVAEGQGFFVNPGCTNFIRDMDEYVNDEPGKNRIPSERPNKGHSDCCDAHRYAEMGIVALGWDNPKAQRNLRMLATTR